MRDPLRRLLSMRWLSASLMLGVALAAEPVFGIGVPSVAILVIALALGIWNLFAHLNPPLMTTASILTELLVDLAAWASFLYLTGGATNPMASLLLPLLAVAATLLPIRHAWWLAGGAITIYAALWFFNRPLRLPDPTQAALWHLAGMEASFAVSAAVVVWFVSRLTQTIRQQDRTLADAREQSLRNERIVALANQAASAAHELGTPLGTMRLLVTELAHSIPDHSAQEDLRLVNQQIEQCKSILSRLTEASGAARAPDRRRQTVREWLDTVAAAVRCQRPDARMELGRVPQGPIIETDTAMDHALHNLLTNAIKAAPDAPVELELRFRNGLMDLMILDHGDGIPEDLANHTRADARASLPSEGLGIGLLLTQAAIEAHGGSLSYQKRPGGGTIALMTLPIASP